MKKILTTVMFVLLSAISLEAQINSIGLSYSSHKFNTRDFSAGGFHVINFSNYDAHHFSFNTKLSDKVSLETRLSLGDRNVEFTFEDSPIENLGFISIGRTEVEDQNNRFYSMSLDFNYKVWEPVDGFSVSPLIGLDIMYEDHENKQLNYVFRPRSNPESESVIFQYTELVHYKFNPFLRFGLDIEKSIFSTVFMTIQVDYSIPVLGTYSTQELEFVQFEGDIGTNHPYIDPIVFEEDQIRNRLFTLNTRIGLSYKFR